MAMRETERSLRGFFIIAGGIGIWAGVRDLREALALPSIPLHWAIAIWIPVLLNLVIAPAILYAGLKLKTVLLTGARWVQHVLVLSGAVFVFELALAYLVMAAVLIVRPWGLFGVREA